jgi:branched-chain amino acid transport system ATP-binding protein
MNILEVKDLSLRFGGIVALNNVSISLRKGEILAIVGPNGSGKTSLLNCICGFYKPQSGRIIYKGVDITKMPIHKRMQMGIGRTLQTPYVFPGTVYDNILVGYIVLNGGIFRNLTYRAIEEARRRAEELIDFVELEPYRDMLATELPMGIRKKIELARVLMWNPDTILLDEPTSGLSLDERRDMARYILELNEVWGKNIILIEHEMNLVRDIAHRIVVLDSGVKIAEGPFEEIVKDARVLAAYLGE